MNLLELKPICYKFFDGVYWGYFLIQLKFNRDIFIKATLGLDCEVQMIQAQAFEIDAGVCTEI